MNSVWHGLGLQIPPAVQTWSAPAHWSYVETAQEPFELQHEPGYCGHEPGPHETPVAQYPLHSSNVVIEHESS
jgi:hypothetical protein